MTPLYAVLVLYDGTKSHRSPTKWPPPPVTSPTSVPPCGRPLATLRTGVVTSCGSGVGAGGKQWRWDAVAGVRGLWLCDEFLSADEQERLLAAIEREKWFSDAHNQAIRFGDLPSWAVELSTLIRETETEWLEMNEKCDNDPGWWIEWRRVASYKAFPQWKIVEKCKRDERCLATWTRP
ncbi:hypothetical protein EJB05_26148, partial [Eragrostis curvula]